MRNGFSLLESLVAMGILLIITSFGVANYNYTSKKQALEATADKLRQAMQTAKSNTMSGKKNTTVCGINLFTGWSVEINNSTKTITTKGLCPPAAPFGSTTISFPSTVSITGGISPVTFQPLYGKPDIVSTATYTLTSTGVNNKTVVLSVNGEISVP